MRSVFSRWWLVDNPWNRKGKRRNQRVEFLTRARHHGVAPMHRSHGGAKRTETGVFEGSSRRQDRLFADDTRSLNTLLVRIRVGDDPFPAEELGGLVPHVGHADAIREEEVALLRLAPLLDVLAHDFNADSAGGGVGHSDASLSRSGKPETRNQKPETGNQNYKKRQT